ncbi:cell migration-inducing and hyaluronan-binding protein-like [Pomacea canaliculata]|uniref:cell migration-inducing and hyaluronan-binding protein-like n=1 Tax=Pomacea canaliculata TaxID=400727 RepID=UPI000D73CA73|nr:cell migration-inducing and hyaluronan-binding protein-like [Pomacea canaliculata]XP_025088485.1 cell migration-inducing and hyaluronan-binding protein-like [Pomacea canaliculata]
MKEGYVLVMTSLWLLGGVSSQDCPWEEQGLLPWSDAMTWESFLIPSEGSEILISTGKRVLLDIQPPRLATITIQKGAALIWGNVSGLVLRVEYIMVEGEFIVGSEVCPFIHKAHIKLYGKSDSRYFIDDPNFGRKFIGVPEGGTLELHGKPKTSWTRLSQTIPELDNIECGVVYNHSSQLIGKERQKGLHVIIWNEDGSPLDFDVFDLRTFENVSKFVQTIPDGKIIGMFLFGSDGIGRRGDPAQNGKLAYLDMTIQKLGGDVITKVTDTDSYSFIVRKGDPSSASESYLPDGQRFPGEERYLHLTDWSNTLTFRWQPAHPFHSIIFAC